MLEFNFVPAQQDDYICFLCGEKSPPLVVVSGEIVSPYVIHVRCVFCLSCIESHTGDQSLLTAAVMKRGEELLKSRPEGAVFVVHVDVGNRVICDMCGDEYTGKSDNGGILFGSKACCPVCTVRLLKSLPFGEKENIKAYCPLGMSFYDWVLALRSGSALL